MEHILARQSIFIRLYRLLMHGLLTLVLILPPLLGEEAQGEEVKLDNTTKIEQQQTASNLNQRRRQNIVRRERDQIA